MHLYKICVICGAGQFNKLVYDYPIRIPERFSLVIRSLLTQEGICFTLKPDFKFLEVMMILHLPFLFFIKFFSCWSMLWIIVNMNSSKEYVH